MGFLHSPLSSLTWLLDVPAQLAVRVVLRMDVDVPKAALEAGLFLERERRCANHAERRHADLGHVDLHNEVGVIVLMLEDGFENRQFI